MTASSKVKRTWNNVWKRKPKNYFYRPYISKSSSKHSDESSRIEKKTQKKESDVISWADATKHDLEVQNQGLHLPLANRF